MSLIWSHYACITADQQSKRTMTMLMPGELMEYRYSTPGTSRSSFSMGIAERRRRVELVEGEVGAGEPLLPQLRAEDVHRIVAILIGLAEGDAGKQRRA